MSVNRENGQGPLVTTQWLEDHLEDENLRILDCTVIMEKTSDGGYSFRGGASEYAAGHIPGAQFVDVLGSLADPDSPYPMMLPGASAFAAAMQAVGVGDDTFTVIYDRSNHAWAARVWWMLKAYGYETAAVLDGGLRKWEAESRPMTAEVVEVPEASLTLARQKQRMADKLEVLMAINDSRTTLVNALSPEEHCGVASRFARPGRIPGSKNVYCQSLIDEQSHAFLPESELREIFAPSGAVAAQRTITYCGAGVAASADALILTLLGAENVAVYDGSLSEWTSDPAAPLEVD